MKTTNEFVSIRTMHALAATLLVFACNASSIVVSANTGSANTGSANTGSANTGESGSDAESSAGKPNIVFVLFDDMGWGQPPSYGPASALRTPNLDKLAQQGMRFTDAHSASAVCTPTRYGLLTGRYPARIGQFGVLTTYSAPIIPSSRLTVASMLKRHGYSTACIGKWHLGMNWVDVDPPRPQDAPLGATHADGPNAVGFDYFYGFTHARSIGSIIEQDRVVVHVKPVENQPLMIEKALEWIGQRKAQEPFFLYFPMCPPHTPVAPAPEFIGQSGAQDLVKHDPRYGDWVYQGDAMLGQIMAVLEHKNLADNTLLIAAADNGAAGRSYAPLRAQKTSIYEGGHRVPFVARWPGKVKPGSTWDHTICLNDLMATTAKIVGAPLPAGAAEDSVSILPALLGSTTAPTREATIHQSMRRDLAIRQGPWKAIYHRDGKRELFNLANDLSETKNVLPKNRDVEAKLTDLFQGYIDRGRSTPGDSQPIEHRLTLDSKAPAAKSQKLSTEKRNKKRPNILFILADDMAFDTIAAHGNREIETPNLDRLARAGTTFSHAYNMGGWNGAVCVASRTMLNTGQFIWRAHRARLQEMAEEKQMWSQLMASAGYDTYFTGKWHIQPHPSNVFDSAQHVRGGMPNQSPAGYNRPLGPDDNTWKPWHTKYGGFWQGGKHWSEVVGDDAESFLASAAKSDDPFFMAVAFNAPHDPRQSPQEFVDRYPLDKISLPQPFLPEYPFDIESNHIRDEKLAPFPRTEYAVKVNRQEYYAIITHMDAQIGRILDSLEKSGMRENTYIFFTADHGLAAGHHGLMGKQNMYDHSLRVPWMVVGPGIEADRTIAARVYMQDVMPTTLELAGVEKPGHVEFRSVLPLIRGEREGSYQEIYGAYTMSQRMITVGDYKLIVYPKIGKKRLFHLGDDPLEMNDLVDEPASAGIVKRLTEQLKQLQASMDDELDLDNSAPKEKKDRSNRRRKKAAA